MRKGVHFERDIQDISSRLLPAEAPEALAPPLTPVNNVRSPLYPPHPTQIRLVLLIWRRNAEVGSAVAARPRVAVAPHPASLDR